MREIPKQQTGRKMKEKKEKHVIKEWLQVFV